MIKFSLKCVDSHEFEAWFASSSAYEKQSKAGQVLCPACGTEKVEKALMAPNIVSGQRPEPAAKPGVQNAPPPETMELLRKFKTFIEQNSEYVGPRFAEEARKIHHKESEARSIYGEASDGDAHDLLEEGVELYALPVLPEDHN
jgi:hypothetical protein